MELATTPTLSFVDLEQVIAARVGFTATGAEVNIVDEKLRLAIEIAAPAYGELLTAARDAGLEPPTFTYRDEQYCVYEAVVHTSKWRRRDRPVTVLGCELASKPNFAFHVLTPPRAWNGEIPKQMFCDWNGDVWGFRKFALCIASGPLVAAFAAQSQAVIEQITGTAQTHIATAQLGLAQIGQINAEDES